ncbi:hypothetical protein [Streptomyces sp. NPDC007883]|uniref:hypothetical protein n=1 Tax=Streptomyces sp. NPDC007883 TaxID=3155116 RepID=UPI003405D2AA
MTPRAGLLDLIRTAPDVEALLSSFGFDVGRKPSGEGERLASGSPLEAVAGEFSGGSFFLCPEEDGRRAVVFANSEGEGGLIADDLASALEIVIGLQWQDCLRFSGGGDLEVMQATAQHLERYSTRDRPGVAEDRARAAAALSLEVVPVPDLVARLHDAVWRTEPLYVVIADDGQACDPLFGEHSEPRLGGWS